MIRIDADAVESEKVVFLKNTRNKRQLVNLLGLPQDNIQTLAIEGSTLTLMGLVKYDANRDDFEMTQLYSIIAGGVDETCELLKHRIESTSADSKTCFMMASICLLLGGLTLYGWWGRRRVRQ